MVYPWIMNYNMQLFQFSNIYYFIKNKFKVEIRLLASLPNFNAKAATSKICIEHEESIK